MMTFTLAEKIATVAKARASGNFGQWQDMGFGRAKVTVDGVVCLVSTSAVGWLVGRIGFGFIAEDADLELAAQMALQSNN